MFRLILLSSLLITALFSSDISEQDSFNNLLPNASIYIDRTNTLGINEVSKQIFLPNFQEQLSFGYSPNFTVWIKFKLTNHTSKPMPKIIEYANPLSTNVTFFDPKSDRRVQEGLIHISSNRESLNPIFSTILEPNSSKIFYIKASSHITTLIVDLHLWDKDHFYKYERTKQFILAMFFGAMGLIILYNLFIYISTREVSYLYYVLFFLGITIHHAIYKGVVSLYLLEPATMRTVIEFSSLIVALPTLFLALFTKSILNLKQYPIVNKVLNIYLIIFLIATLFIYWTQSYSYRNIFSVTLLILLFSITCYAFLKKNRQAHFIIFGWFLFLTSGIFMYLSSLGVYDIFASFPYYTEISLVLESLIFSLSLSDKIKQLQNNLIHYQKREKIKLSKLVKMKTDDLEKSVEEKELLLRELNHRVKNNIQTIVAFLRLHRDEIEDSPTQEILKSVENRVMAINHLYALLYTKENISFVNSYEYFSLIIDDIEMSYQKLNIKIVLTSNIDIPSEYAIYCGFILNEAITNAFKHAFNNREKGVIFIELTKQNALYRLLIKDNGVGYNREVTKDTLGVVIIETLVVTQLGGNLHIDSNNGVEITITWSDKKDDRDFNR